MRFLFLAPLSTKRHCHAVAQIASALGQIGHDCHIFARENTRVELNGTPVLSKNAVHIESLEQSLGKNSVSKLHSNLTARTFQAESILLQSDETVVREFIKSYCPDALLCSIDDLITVDDAVIRVATNTAQNTLKLCLIAREKRQYWLMDVDTRKETQLFLDPSAKLMNTIQKSILGRLDSKYSGVALQKIIAVNAGKFKELEHHAEVVIADVADKSKTVSISGSLSNTLGEIESFKDADVVFGNTLWLKGWIDFSVPELKLIIVRINDSMHRCVPNVIRGDLAEKLRNSNILNFEAHLPISDEGTRLSVKINLLSTDGHEHKWKEFFLWSNDTIPQRYKSPVVLGSIQLEQQESLMHLVGKIDLEGHPIIAIRAIQLGVVVGEQLWQETPACSQTNVRISLSTEFDPGYPVHLWIEIHGQEPVFWLRCEPANTDAISLVSLGILSVSAGQVVRGDKISMDVVAHPPARQVRVFINGAQVATECSLKSSCELSVPIGNRGNNLLLEVFDEQNRYSRSQLWRHLAEPQKRKNQTVISVPGSTVCHMFDGGNRQSKRKRDVVLIRKAPAPTDDLYILSPLRELVDAGRITLAVIDTDNNVLNEPQMEALLKPGTAVVVSRYISDYWIAKITNRKSLLGPIFYLMDDDVLAAEDSMELPSDYRLRMMKVAHGEFQTMVNIADRFIVTSEFLARRFRSAKTDLLEPPYLNSPTDLSHLTQKRPIVIAYHGTLAHRNDVDCISIALRNIHERYSNVKIQLIIGNWVPSALKGLSRLECISGMQWAEYKQFVKKTRAHIAIAPILNTPYNLGKSIIKIFDISALGAVGLYTKSEPYTKYIQSGSNGFLLENDPLIWQKTMSWLVENPDEIERIAKNAQILAHDIGDLSRLTMYWKRHLGIDEGNGVTGEL